MNAVVAFSISDCFVRVHKLLVEMRSFFNLHSLIRKGRQLDELIVFVFELFPAGSL